MRKKITGSMFFMFMVSSIIFVSGQGMVYSRSISPKCPNAGSGPPNPPCPGGGCPPSGGPTPGGNLNCPPSGGIGDMTTNDSYVGDPINISTGSVTKTVIDASIPVKYGGLGVSRTYSSEVFDTKNSNGLTMFGPHWHGNYEYRLTDGDRYLDNGRYYTDIHFLDADGSHYDFYYAFSETDSTGGNVGVYRSHIVQGAPMELRSFASSGNLVITRSDHSEIIFETYQGEYRVIALEGNRDTFAQERIEFTYDTLGRLSEVHANGDDRYLEFTYDASSLQVDQVSLATASSSVALADYGYALTLLTTFERPESGVGSYQIIYEYGSFDGTNLNSISGQPYILGRVSYDLNGRLYYLNAYEYEDRVVGGVSKPHMAVASYHDAGDEDWVKVVEVDYIDWYNVETIYPCNTTNKPKSLDTLDWQHDLLTRSYENLGTYQSQPSPDPDHVPMPVYATSVATKSLKVPSTSMLVYTPGMAVSRPRIRTGAALYDTVAGTFSINVMDNQFTFADPDPFLNTDANYLYQFYKTSSTRYSTTDASSAITTTYHRYSPFPHLIGTITNHDGGEVSYNYGTNTSITNEYARLTSSLDLDDHPTLYTYYSNGLLGSSRFRGGIQFS